MKKRLLALAVGSFVAFPAVSLADSGPTVYGKVNASFENVDDGAADQWELRSNASRLGFKGDIDLDFEDVKAIYKAEYQVSVDGDDEEFSQRNIYGGLQSARAGTLIAGNFDTPFKAAQGDVDQFGDLGGDIGNGFLGGEERVSNIIQYSTPSLADVLTLNAAFIAAEGDNEFAPGDDRDGPADAFSMSAVYDDGLFYGALAYDSEVTTDLIDLGGQDTLVDAIRAVGGVSFDRFELGALVQRSESSESVNLAGVESPTGSDYEDTSYLVSGAFSATSRLKLKAQYGITDLDQSDDEVTLMAVGADYKLASASKVFTYYANVESDENPSQRDDTFFGIGIEHKFSM